MEPEKKNVQSMVEAADSISSSFSRLKFITVMCVVGLVLGVGGTAAWCMYMLQQGSGKVYVLDGGQAFTATRQDASISRIDEVRDQSRRLHELLFNVSPNRDVNMQNLERALEISDRSVYNYYNDLQESGFYKRIYQSNASQQIVVDSIKVDMSRKPYVVRTFASQYITRESNITKQLLVTQCGMIEVNRNEKNMHGLQVEKFEILQNQTIETRRR